MVVQATRAVAGVQRVVDQLRVISKPRGSLPNYSNPRHSPADSSLSSESMNTFRVWTRALGTTCRVRVDGVKNANWLLNRLSDSFIFKTAEPIDEDVGASCATFRVLYTSQISRSSFEKLLGAIPQVELMLDPA
jgi:hypothetical protein